MKKKVRKTDYWKSRFSNITEAENRKKIRDLTCQKKVESWQSKKQKYWEINDLICSWKKWTMVSWATFHHTIWTKSKTKQLTNWLILATLNDAFE